jgi:hypothetical protein
MTQIDLQLGPLRAAGFNIFRSGIRWLYNSGQQIRSNQIFGYCNISLEAASRFGGGPPFAEELELQVAFAPRVSGRVFTNEAAARGGYLSVRGIDTWDPDSVVARIEPDTETCEAVDPSRMRLLALAGRRVTALADVHSGLMPGWLGRSRAWWCEEGEIPQTLLSMGICDATGVIVGEQCAFAEMFEASRIPSQMVFIPDHPLAPAAPVLMEQLWRTPAQFDAIAGDLKAFLARSKVGPFPDDWIFAGTLLSVMQRNPVRESYNIFSGDGLNRLGPAEAVLLSLNAEPQSILRHAQLGYHLHVMRHHQAAAGPAIRAWLAETFEIVKRSIDDIKRDYEALIDAVSRATGAHIIVLNRMSTSGYEDISSYMGFDAPLSDTLANVASKELNLMLEDIADDRDLHIVDVDAIAAEIGGRDHLPDGIHQSGLMQTALREEILHIFEEIVSSQKQAKAKKPELHGKKV